MKQQEMLNLNSTFAQELHDRCLEKGISFAVVNSRSLPIELQVSLQVGPYHTVYSMNNQLFVLYNDGTNAHWKEVVY